MLEVLTVPVAAPRFVVRRVQIEQRLVAVIAVDDLLPVPVFDNDVPKPLRELFESVDLPGVGPRLIPTRRDGDPFDDWAWIKEYMYTPYRPSLG